MIRSFNTYSVAAGLLAATLLFLPFGWAAEISVDGGLVSIDIGEPQSLDEVLQRLGAAMQIEVAGSAGEGTIGPVRLDKVGLAEALVRLAPKRSYIIENAGNPPRPARIVFLGTAAGSGSAGSQPVAQENSPSENKSHSNMLRDIAELSYQPGWPSSRKLQNIIRAGGNEEIKVAAIMALGQFADYGAIPFLGRHLASERDPSVRLAAAEALHITGRENALALIRTAMAKEQDPDVRSRLAELAGQ